MRLLIDLESDGLLDKATTLWCAVVKDFDTKKVYRFYRGSPQGYIPELLSLLSAAEELIIHNGIGFDQPLLKKLFNFDIKCVIIDTLIMSRLQKNFRKVPKNCPNKRAQHSIEAWGYRLGMLKKEHTDWTQFSDAMLERCEYDVLILEKVYIYLLEEGGGAWDKANRLTSKLFQNLEKQYKYGWLIDRDHINGSIHMLDHWIDRIDSSISNRLKVITVIEEQKDGGFYKYVKKPFLKSGELNKHIDTWAFTNLISSYDICGQFSRVSFRKVNLNSNKEVKEFLLGIGWVPTEWNYNDEGKKTSPKLSKGDKFEGIEGSFGRLVVRRVQCRQRKSILTGLLTLIRNDGRMASIVSGLAVTGRAKHRNIVNIPAAHSFFGKWMRQSFICKKGYTLVGTDSAACQIRMLAGRMGDDSYTNAVLNGNSKDGTDIHSVNQRAAKLPNRDIAKTFFYGILFGAGDVKTGKIVNGGAKEGKKLKEELFRGLPALAELIDKLTKEWRETAHKRFNKRFNRMEYHDGKVRGLDGRIITIPSEHQILVYVLQSDEAIMMTAAYNFFHKWMERGGYIYGYDYGVVSWYHDEFTVECRKEIAKKVATLAEESIKKAGEYFKIKCPHKGTAKIGKNWYEIH